MEEQSQPVFAMWYWIYMLYLQSSIKNLFEVLKLIDRELEKLWNVIKEIKDECEKKLPKAKKQKKPNWLSE